MAYQFSRLSSSSSYIPLHKTQLHPRLIHTNPQKPHNHHKHLLIIITLSLIPFTIYLLSLSRSLHPPSSSSFGIVVDIADHTSQILVFRSLNEASGTLFDGHSSDSMRANTGHVGLARDPRMVGRVLGGLIVFAHEKVPSFEWKRTKVQVMVTGDLVGSDGVHRVLKECRRVLRSSGFLFKDDWVSVLKGQDEAVYSWLAVNYALGFIGNTPEDTAGVIALGRSAMQVSFATREPPESQVVRVVTLGGVSYSLYTKSLQQFSQDSIWKHLQEQNSKDLRSFSQNDGSTTGGPCTPRGYVPTLHASDEKLVQSFGSGNLSSCTFELSTLLSKKQECAQPPCNLLSVLEKKPHHRQRFFLSSQLLGLASKASLPKLESAGHHFCEDDWENLKSQVDSQDVDLSQSCFSHAFVIALLHSRFGIPFDEKRVEFAAGSTPVDWRFGVFISQTLMATPEKQEVENHKLRVVENESITYFLLLAVLLVFVLLSAFLVMKLRKPQVKTIYDLEKGCYIVTRVPR